MWAAHFGRQAICELLVNAGAKADAVDGKGRDASEIAKVKYCDLIKTNKQNKTKQTIKIKTLGI